jgi:RimJ/RimL family protein N-acetyltransferase
MLCVRASRRQIAPILSSPASANQRQAQVTFANAGPPEFPGLESRTILRVAPLMLHGGRVILRPIRTQEFDRLYEARVQSATAVGPVDSDAFRERMAHSGEWFDGRLDLAIESDGRLVGTIDARAPARFSPPGVCELGLEVFDEARGRGVGTEAVRLITEWLLENDYQRVQATTDVRNAPMRRVLEKLGFAEEGVLRAFMPDDDGRADYVLYAITR